MCENAFYNQKHLFGHILLIIAFPIVLIQIDFLHNYCNWGEMWEAFLRRGCLVHTALICYILWRLNDQTICLNRSFHAWSSLIDFKLQHIRKSISIYVSVIRILCLIFMRLTLYAIHFHILRAHCITSPQDTNKSGNLDENSWNKYIIRLPSVWLVSIAFFVESLHTINRCSVP